MYRYITILILVTCVLFLHPSVAIAQGEGGLIWRLVETVDFENQESWALSETDYWKFEHTYSQGNYSARIWHQDEETYIAYGAVANWSQPPATIAPGTRITLNASLTETVNTHRWNTSAASTWADFAPPHFAPGTRGYVAFINDEGLDNISINGASSSSASATFTANAPSGAQGDRIALRLVFYMGNTMGTNYVYELQPAGAATTTTSATTSPITTTRTATTTSKPAATKTTITVTDLVDSGVRFAGLSGQVEVRHDYDEDAWDFAGMGQVLYCEDHIRTGPRSSAILSFKDLSTFVIGPDTEIVLATPPEKESKLQLVAGNLWANIKKMAKDGTMEITMNQAVSGIKGTTFVCEDNGVTSTLKVIDGTVEFTDTIGNQVTVKKGEKVSAAQGGMSAVEEFDIKQETERWEEAAITGAGGNSGLIIGIVVAAVVVIAGATTIVIRRKSVH